ncbi:hypothetical protein DFS34DRAFT_101480 [Phlyctochytrium arcticum]|nr:hypothetical protein DFS34DRAFT_101480 [Phlyctochytrium arcticum]
MAPPPPSVTMASAGSEEGDQSVKHEQTAPTVLAPFGGEDMEDAGQEDGECYEGMGEMEESEDLEDGAVTPTPHSLLAHTRNNTTTTTKSTGPAAVVVAQALLALPSQSELKNNNDTPHEPKMASVAASKPPTTVLEKRPALRDAMTLVASPVSLSPPQLTSPTTTNREALFVPPFKASFTRILISALKAYFSGYAVATVPSVVSLIIKTISGGPGTTKNPAAAKARLTFLATSLIKLLTRSFRARLPWFFLVLIGGFRLFDRLFWDIARYVKWKPLDGNTTVMWDGKHRALDVSRRRLSGSPPVVVVGSVLAEEIEIEGVPKAAEEDVLSDTKTVVPGNVLQMEPLDIARSGTSSDVNNTLTAENKIVQLRLQEMQQRQAAKDRDKDLARHIIPPARNILSPTFFAGATASALALLIIEPARRADFALFTLVRAADSLTAFQSHKIKSSLNGWVPPFLLNNMDTAVFVTCCSQIMFCWFF